MSRLLPPARVVITAGPTREYGDPVRYLTNASSGRMGFELARVFARRGARVSLISGPVDLTPPKNVRFIPVVSARDMAAAVRRCVRSMDLFIATAAVGDWRFARVRRQKWKKGRRERLTVRLEKNPDVLAWVGHRRYAPGKRPLIVGFALETKRVKRHAQAKLREKRADLIIGNRPGSFGSSRIRPVWAEAAGPVQRLPLLTKAALARRVAAWAERASERSSA